ncbi:MAG: hypothetical protein ABI239_00100, partial [Aquihabitans sp.]
PADPHPVAQDIARLAIAKMLPRSGWVPRGVADQLPARTLDFSAVGGFEREMPAISDWAIEHPSGDDGH